MEKVLKSDEINKMTREDMFAWLFAIILGVGYMGTLILYEYNSWKIRIK